MKKILSSIKNGLFDMLSSDNSNTLSNARVQSFILFCVGTVLLVLYYCGVGVNVEVAYTMVGIASASGTIKSVSSTLTNNNQEEKTDE